jgi:hypothetical protein
VPPRPEHSLSCSRMRAIKLLAMGRSLGVVARLVLALGLVLGTMLGVAATSRAISSPPTLVSPTNGTSFEADAPPQFVVRDNPPPPGLGVSLTVSSSPTLNSQGALAGSVHMMLQGGTEPSVYTWQPEGGVQYYQWAAGTYYWQASHRGYCTEGEVPRFDFTECTVYSPVWQFVVTPIPPPEAVSPADGAMLPLGTTVEFVVHSVVSRLTPESQWLPTMRLG